MKICKKKPRRTYIVGKQNQVTISDCGTIQLENDEQVTFIDTAGSEYDVTAKNFGYYATPSTNSRLARFGYKTALVINTLGRVFVLLVRQEKEKEFLEYLAIEELAVLGWLDDAEYIKKLVHL